MPSINDMIVNPLGGLPIGETFFQLGQYFRRSSPNPFNVTAATLLSPLVTAHDLIEGRRRAFDAVDDLGLSREVWHRFTLAGGFGPTSYGEGTQREAKVALRTELVNIPGYGVPVNAASSPRLGAMTRLELELAFDQRELTVGRFTTEALLGGLFRQRATRDEAGRRGLGWLLGLSSAFDFSVHRYPGLREDLLAQIGIAGPLVEASAFVGGLRLRARAQGYLDFAMVRPHVLDEFLQSTDNFRGIKSSLEWYGYYYALGPTLAARLSAEHGVLDGGAEARWDRFFSLQGRDRFQEEVTDDFALRDERMRLRGWLGVRVPTTRVRFALEAEQLRRSGSIPARGLELVTTERRALGLATLVF
jgi:hypothetical protein